MMVEVVQPLQRTSRDRHNTKAKNARSGGQIRCFGLNIGETWPLTLEFLDAQDSPETDTAQLMVIGGLTLIPGGPDGSFCPYPTSTQLLPSYGG